MIKTVAGVEGDSFFAGGDSGVPVVEFDMGAAEQVVGFRSGGGSDLLFEHLDGLVNSAGGEEILGILGGSERECDRE
jgi:hypothetical protein